MPNIYFLGSEPLSIAKIRQLLDRKTQLDLSPDYIQKIEASRQYLADKISQSDDAFYGINTGFGSLCNEVIDKADLETLQANLVMSHAAGTGASVPAVIIRLMLLLKIKSLAQGFSGVQLVTVQRLVQYYNFDILPVIYTQGSLGASGDLAPLAHLSLPLLGKGKVYSNGKIFQTADIDQQYDWTPIVLQAKEGLALLNGTQFSTAYAVWCTMESQRLMDMAQMVAAFSFDVFYCRRSPLDDRIHQIRLQNGQIKTAKVIRHLLTDSELEARSGVAVQDPYAFRCVPQVHGASYDALQYVAQIVERESNAVTDNPNIFYEDDAILSGGNFHAQPMALSLDFLAIAMAEMASISERRTFQLLSGQRGLPPFLIKKPGLNSGLMIAQYTAASIVSQNKQYCTPASVDSIVSSNGQEDHVSMAANAATKCYEVIKNVETVLAIEFMTAAQGMEFRRPGATSPILENVLSAYRKIVPALETDRILSDDIQATVKFLRTVDFL